MALSADDMMAQLVLDALFAGAAGWSHRNRAFLSCMLGEVRKNEKKYFLTTQLPFRLQGFQRSATKE
jgi:hypothetical protein